MSRLNVVEKTVLLLLGLLGILLATDIADKLERFIWGCAHRARSPS